jgi:hypothetical protein
MASAKWYNTTLAAQFGSEGVRKIDWVKDPIKVVLLNNTYAPDPHKDTHFSDISDFEISGTGYSPITLTGKTIETNVAESEIRLRSSLNPKWMMSTFTARWAVVYKATTLSTLIGYVDFGSDMEVANGTFNIDWDTTGVLKIVTI